LPASCQCAVSAVFLSARLRRVRLVVRTQPSQGWYTGSTPVRAAKAKSNFDALSQQIRNKMRICEVRLRKDKRGVDLISDVLPFGRLLYGEPNAISNAIGYAEHYSRAHDAVMIS
jgi:hypothetical protein